MTPADLWCPSIKTHSDPFVVAAGFCVSAAPEPPSHCRTRRLRSAADSLTLTTSRCGSNRGSETESALLATTKIPRKQLVEKTSSSSQRRDGNVRRRQHGCHESAHLASVSSGPPHSVKGTWEVESCSKTHTEFSI